MAGSSCAAVRCLAFNVIFRYPVVPVGPSSKESSGRNDRQLVELINNGDDSAFGDLYYRYRDWVARLAFRFTGNSEDALDVLQEAFIYLAAKSPALELAGKMTTFLYPVVKNLSLAMLRKRRMSLADDRLLDGVLAPQEIPGATRAELADVLASLPHHQREVVLMRFVDDMSLEEIADALQVPLGTVKSRLHNALVALRTDPRTKQYFNEP